MLKNSVAILMVTTMFAGIFVQSAIAQPGYGQPGYSTAPGGDYNAGPPDRYRQGYDEGSDRVRYDDRGPDVQSSGDFNDQRQSWRQRYQREYTYQDDNYYRQCRTQVDPAGVIAGALIGGLLGNALGQRGRRGVPTIAGVVVGGALGAALTRNLSCEDQSYAYNTYYNGFNSGRTNVPYQWRNPNSGNYGEVRVNNYFNDPGGFRCANFNQQIFINRRPQAASGRACQQPDGTWAVVN